MDLTALGSTVQTVFAVVAFIAAAYAAIQYASLKTLRDSNEDLRNRDRDRAAQIAELQAKVLELEALNTALGAAVRGDAYLTALSDDLTDHHKEAMQHWDDIRKQMVQVMGALERIATSQEDLYRRMALPVRRDQGEGK